MSGLKCNNNEKKELTIDNLELYMNDVYEKECLFKVGKGEVEFIQNGIETLVQTIVDLALQHFSHTEATGNLYETLKILRSETCPSDIIKAGSFYEGTKNNFPDEFDFIFLLYCTDKCVQLGENNLSIPDYSNQLQMPLTNAILGLLQITKKNKDFLKSVSPDSTKKLYFDEYVYAKGPSAKLRFIYENDSNEKREIYVDLVPAIRQYGDRVERTVSIICPLKEFRKEILLTESFLYINSFFANYTFTETELRFMKYILSEFHVKVYRILKFLINGHGDDEALKNFLQETHAGDKSFKLYSSYRIKTVMIYHHYQCTNTEQTNIGYCILKILNEICKYPDIESFPKLIDKIDAFKSNRVDVHNPWEKQHFFTIKSNDDSKMLLQPYLQLLTDHLVSMQRSVDCYDYEKDKVAGSVSRLYLENQSK